MPTDALFEKLRLAERRPRATFAAVIIIAIVYSMSAWSITTAYDGEVVSRTRNVHALEDSVIRLMEAEQEYVEAERQYSDLRNQVCSLLQRLDDPMNADILRLRYVEHKRMPAIAKELHLSRSSIYSRHEIALSELQGILQTQST